MRKQNDEAMPLQEVLKKACLSSKEVLTLEEAVEFSGMSKSCIYKLTHGQKIPHYKPNGKLIYFKRVELEAWLQQNRIGTSDEIEMDAQTYCMKTR